MTLPASGTMSMDMVAGELEVSATGLSMGDSRCRELASKPSGPISMFDFYGKSAGTGTIFVAQAPGYNARGYSEAGYEFPAFGGLNAKPINGGVIQSLYFDYSPGFLGNTYTVSIYGDLSGHSLRLICGGLDQAIQFTGVGTSQAGAQVSIFMGQGTDVFSPNLGRTIPFTIKVV